MDNPQTDRGIPETYGHELHPEARPDIHDILIKHNSSVEKIVEKLLPSLDAMRYDAQGDETKTPDWSARIKGGTLLMTTLGYMKGQDINVNVGVSKEEKEVEEMFKEWRGLKCQVN